MHPAGSVSVVSAWTSRRSARCGSPRRTAGTVTCLSSTACSRRRCGSRRSLSTPGGRPGRILRCSQPTPGGGGVGRHPRHPDLTPKGRWGTWFEGSDGLVGVCTPWGPGLLGAVGLQDTPRHFQTPPPWLGQVQPVADCGGCVRGIQRHHLRVWPDWVWQKPYHDGAGKRTLG